MDMNCAENILIHGFMYYRINLMCYGLAAKNNNLTLHG